MTTWTFEVPDDLTLDLRCATGRVDVVAGPAGQAEVTVTDRGNGGRSLADESRVEVTGDRLVVHVPEGGGRRSVWFVPRRLGSVAVRIALPASTLIDAHLASADLDVAVPLRAVAARSASGDVHLGDASGDVSINTASGDVRVGQVGGDLSVATASGDLRTGDVDRAVSVRTASGDVALGALAGDVRVRTVSGDVAVRGLGPGDGDIASTSGDLKLAVAPGLTIHLDVSSVTGDLHSDLGAGSDDGEVDLSLRARTVSGDVTITRSQAPGGAHVV